MNGSTPPVQAALTREQAEAYLARIQLPTSLVKEQASLALLSQILLAHHESVPKDTSPLHVPEEDWNVDKPIVLGANFPGMPVGIKAYDRIVNQHKGAFCFAVNASFSALLRFWGFRVSEVVSRAYQRMGSDPTTHPDGYIWGAMTHQLMVADWEESQGKRYLVDVGMGGGGCPLPIELKDGHVQMGLNNYEAWRLVKEPLPLGSKGAYAIDVVPGWTLYRRVPQPNTPIHLPISEKDPGFWSPQVHFLLHSISLIEFEEHHLFSAYSPLASFTAFFLVTKLIPGTKGARRSIMFSEARNGKPKEGVSEGGKHMARIHTTGGEEANGSTSARDISYIEMRTGPMRKELEENWGFKFD